jgi:hypothetical protein
MINVNQITAQLARMPDQALQQYAQMHKSDPYILSLALSESNRRKQMRQGAQMQAPAQPKVVDQAVSEMAAPMPEDVGIAKLPAGGMNFADGGIVAFGDGGEVPTTGHACFSKNLPIRKCAAHKKRQPAHKKKPPAKRSAKDGWPNEAVRPYLPALL